MCRLVFITVFSRSENEKLPQNNRQAIYTGNTIHLNNNVHFPLCENGQVKRFQERERTLEPRIHKE